MNQQFEVFAKCREWATRFVGLVVLHQPYSFFNTLLEPVEAVTGCPMHYYFILIYFRLNFLVFPLALPLAGPYDCCIQNFILARFEVRIQSDTHVQIKKAFEVVRCITALY
jgi:hypothetical protein